MALVTGTPLGTITSQEDLYVEGAPYIYFQDNNADPLFNPDANGFYFGMSGTSSYPVKLLGCIQDVSLTEGVTMNDVRCDTIGVKDTIQKRNYVEFNLTLLSLFPISVANGFLNLGGTVSSGTGYETAGIGGIPNTQKYMVYAPKVYDEVNGYWLLFHLHAAKFVDAWTINMRYGQSWDVTGLKIRAYADETKPTTQRFGVIHRVDLNALP